MKVQDLVKFNRKFDEPFDELPISSTSIFSQYSISRGAKVNRVSADVLDLIHSVYMAETNNKIDLGIGLGKTANGTTIALLDWGNYVEICSYYQYELSAFIVEKDTMNIRKFDSSNSGMGTMVLLLALWDVLENDIEFQASYLKFKRVAGTIIDISSGIKNGNSDIIESLFILSDNIYRRLNEAAGNYEMVYDKTAISENFLNGLYRPSKIIFGNMDFLGGNEKKNNSNCISATDFVGKYLIDPERILTEEEKLVMAANKLEDFYVVSEDDIEICEDIVNTTNTSKPFRTFTLVGEPGSGKSHKVKAVANAIGLPNYIFTCNPSTEIFDLTGQIMPPNMDDMEKEAWNLAAKVEELGGLNFQNIAKIYGLPDMIDVVAAPDDVYEEITGNAKTQDGKIPTVNDALSAWTVHMTEKFNYAFRQMKVAIKTGSGFRFTKTDFMRAVENGYVIEVQEPNVILNEGVLVGLNSLLNEGVITLQDGRTVKRHKDNIIVFTTNYNLNG